MFFCNISNTYDKLVVKLTKGLQMKKLNVLLISMLNLAIVACASDKHARVYNPQKIVDAVSAKYPTDKSTLVFIEAPDGFVSPGLANDAVETAVDNADVVAITSALALKTTTVIIAGDDESLTTNTLVQALKTGKDKINGSKAVVVNNAGMQETSLKTITDLASAGGVALEFIDNPI